MPTPGVFGPRYNLDRAEDREALMRFRSPTEDGRPQALPRSWAYGSPEAEAAGFRTTMDYPDMLPDPKDWKEIIADCHARKLFPMYYRRAAVAAGKLRAKPTQNGLPFCWAWGCAHAIEDRYAMHHGPENAVSLAAVTMGRIVNWRATGYYLNETLLGAQRYGYAPLSYVPNEHSRNPSTFKPGWETAALSYRIAPDGVWDTRRGGEVAMIQQDLAVLRAGVPLYVAHNWWGHALEVTGMVWDERVPNNVVYIHFNSHADGEIELTGSRATPDEAYGIGSLMLPDPPASAERAQ